MALVHFGDGYYTQGTTQKNILEIVKSVHQTLKRKIRIKQIKNNSINSNSKLFRYDQQNLM